MLRNIRQLIFRQYSTAAATPNFLTSEYKCFDAWKLQTSSPILNKVNLNDFSNLLDLNYSSKGVMSAIDVDIFANAINSPAYLDELKELLHKLRLSADTQNTLESTHHATVRNFMEFGNLDDLVQILQDPLNFGIFLDFYAANILMDKMIASQDFKLAANVASLLMLQENFSHDITNALSKYACYKFLLDFERPNEPKQEEDSKKKVEEIKIRIKFLRNPYHDNHFDLRDLYLLSGKTLAWIAKRSSDTVSNNLELIGWLFFGKFDTLLLRIKDLSNVRTFKVYSEVLQLIQREFKHVGKDDASILEQCIEILSTASVVEMKLEESIKIDIENAINKMQSKDILAQNELFKTWERVREDKLEEQSKRLDGLRRIKDIEDKQKSLEIEEQKLWFFEHEEKIDLQIEEKEELEDPSATKVEVKGKSDENYIPPEILPKRK